MPLILKVIYSDSYQVETREVAITSLANLCEGQYGRNTMFLDSKDIEKLIKDTWSYLRSMISTFPHRHECRQLSCDEGVQLCT